MIIYKSRFLTWGEVWFDNDPGSASVDCLIYVQRSSPVCGAKTKDFPVYLIDLERGTEQLRANLKGDTWRKIRRAGEQDGIVIERLNPRERSVMNRFEEFYNRFASIKCLNPLQRRRMEGLAAVHRLDISVAKNPQGEVLVYHANYRDDTQASGINSVSLFRNISDSAFRNMIGRANCYLTWCDFLYYKEQGLKSYDFGGWYIGDDPDKLLINRFKMNFGGQVLHKYWCEKVLTLKGWIVLRAAALLTQRKSSARRSDLNPMPKEAEISPASVAV